MPVDVKINDEQGFVTIKWIAPFTLQEYLDSYPENVPDRMLFDLTETDLGGMTLQDLQDFNEKARRHDDPSRRQRRAYLVKSGDETLVRLQFAVTEATRPDFRHERKVFISCQDAITWLLSE